MKTYVCDNCNTAIPNWDSTLRIWCQDDGLWGSSMHLCPVCYNNVKVVIANALKNTEEHRAKAQAYLSGKRDNDL